MDTQQHAYNTQKKGPLIVTSKYNNSFAFLFPYALFADEWSNIVQPFIANIWHVGSRHSSSILPSTGELFLTQNTSPRL